MSETKEDSMKSGSISYSPDYKSEKRKAGRNTGGSTARKWHGPIGCLFCDYTTKQHHNAGASFDEQQDIISEHLDTHGRWRYHSSEQEERSRLEREVVEAAKAIRGAAKKSYAMPTPGYRSIVERFNDAADALIELESEGTGDTVQLPAAEEPRDASERSSVERETIELVKRWWLGAVSDGALRAKAKDLLAFESEQEGNK